MAYPQIKVGQWSANSKWLIPVLLVVAAVLIRWYYLPSHLFFGFEQGRDAMAIMNIVDLKDFVLVGPKTDIDGVFHGAWYYYLMAIPYGLSGGNPLVASAFLVLLSSLVPVVMYWLLTQLTQSKFWGVVGGLLTVISFEYISYARWLSNVTPAVLLVALTYFCLWQYRLYQRPKWLLGAVTTAVFAAQFQIILLLLWVFVFGVLLLTRVIKFPSLKTILLGMGITLIFLAPMLAFNVRNEMITFKSAVKYVNENEGQGGLSISTLAKYGSKLDRLVRHTLVASSDWRVQALEALLVIAGVSLFMFKPKLRPSIIFLATWSLMSLPVVFFSRSLDLTQLYIGSGLGVIGLLVVILAYFSQQTGTRMLTLATLALVFSSAITVEQKLRENSDVMYRTIQDDLNYRDQQRVLAYIHEDAQAQSYELKAFAIPYFQEQGWQYLYQYYYPQDSKEGAKLIYLVIEEKVEPFWEQKWLEDMRSPSLIEERQIGRLRVQKLNRPE